MIFHGKKILSYRFFFFFFFFFLRTWVSSFSFVKVSRKFRKYYGNIIFVPTSCVEKGFLLLPEVHSINSSFILKFINSSFLLKPIQDGLFRVYSQMGGRILALPSLKYVTHILQWWNLAQLYLTQRRSKKYVNHVTHPLSSADISIFSPEISKFCYIKKYRCRLGFDSNSFDFSWVLNNFFFATHGCNFDDVSKNGYSTPS